MGALQCLSMEKKWRHWKRDSEVGEEKAEVLSNMSDYLIHDKSFECLLCLILCTYMFYFILRKDLIKLSEGTMAQKDGEPLLSQIISTRSPSRHHGLLQDGMAVC